MGSLWMTIAEPDSYSGDSTFLTVAFAGAIRINDGPALFAFRFRHSAQDGGPLDKGWGRRMLGCWGSEGRVRMHEVLRLLADSEFLILCALESLQYDV